MVAAPALPKLVSASSAFKLQRRAQCLAIYGDPKVLSSRVLPFLASLPVFAPVADAFTSNGCPIRKSSRFEFCGSQSLSHSLHVPVVALSDRDEVLQAVEGKFGVDVQVCSCDSKFLPCGMQTKDLPYAAKCVVSVNTAAILASARAAAPPATPVVGNPRSLEQAVHRAFKSLSEAVQSSSAS